MLRILIVSLITFANVCVFAATATRPNIVIIMADDMGYRDLSCYGCLDFETPHIDALAADGIRMTNGYVSHPYCSPSRAGLLTGRYQQRFGHEHNPPYLEDDARIGIDAETRLLPDLFREHGYATGLVGKWHLGAGQPFRPIERGFIEFYGFLGGGHHYFQVKPNGTNYDSPMWRNASPSDDQLTYLTDDLTREAQSLILRHNDQPFCLLLMYNAPHAPDHVTDEYMAMVNHIPHAGRKKYAALVRGVDSGVGQIRKTLNECGLSQNTIVVFLSDNGGRAGVSDNRPLRGNKGWLHEGGIRVPMIVSWPDKIAPGTIYHHAVSSLDLLPTAMSAANIEVPADVDGADLLPYLDQTLHEPPHKTLFWRVCGGEGLAVRHNDWKLVHDVGMSSPELYNLANDPGEDQDLSHSEPELATQLRSLYNAWSATLEKPRWTEEHAENVRRERILARQAGTRQVPMPWVPFSSSE